MPSKTPSFFSASEYLGDELFAAYSRLKQQYPATLPDARPALLAAMGLSAMLADEANALSAALEMVEGEASEDTTHAALGKVLKTYRQALVVSPELAEYIQALPAKERARGETEAEALRTLPKSKASRMKNALEVAPEDMPECYEANARMVQTLLTLDKAMEKAQAILEKQGQIWRAVNALGALGPCANYHDTPLVLCDTSGKRSVSVLQK